MIQRPRGNFKRNRQSGFTMIEVMFSMIIFLMMVVVFAAVFPFAIKASRFSNNYAQAAMLAQHKIDQLRELGYPNIMVNGAYPAAAITTLTSTSPVADSCSVSGTTLTCYFTDVDNIANNGTNIGYFPAGSTGSFTITPDTNAGSDTSSASYNALNVNVVIAWSGAGMSSGRYATTAVLVQNPHS